MAKNQKSYTPEFKQQIVDLHCKAGKGVTALRKNKTIDWQKRESARAKMRMLIKKLLKNINIRLKEWKTLCRLL